MTKTMNEEKIAIVDLAKRTSAVYCMRHFRLAITCARLAHSEILDDRDEVIAGPCAVCVALRPVARERGHDAADVAKAMLEACDTAAECGNVGGQGGPSGWDGTCICTLPRGHQLPHGCGHAAHYYWASQADRAAYDAGE